MLIARKDKAVRIPVILLNASNLPVTAMTATNLDDTTGVGKIGVIKSDGTYVSLTLVNGTTWHEIDSIKAPGLYHVTVPLTDTNLIGSLMLIIRAASSEFKTSYGSVSVEEFHLASQVAKNNWQIHTTGAEANRLVVYDDDGTTVLIRFDLKDGTGAPSTSTVFERDRV